MNCFKNLIESVAANLKQPSLKQCFLSASFGALTASGINPLIDFVSTLHVPEIFTEYIPILTLSVPILSKLAILSISKLHLARFISPDLDNTINLLNKWLPLLAVLTFSASYFLVGMYKLDLLPDSWGELFGIFSDDALNQLKEMFPDEIEGLLPKIKLDYILNLKNGLLTALGSFVSRLFI